jgi:hypothetical protein
MVADVPAATIATGALIGAVGLPSAALFVRFGTRPAPATMFRGMPALATVGAALGIGSALVAGSTLPTQALRDASSGALIGAGVGAIGLGAPALLLPTGSAGAGMADWRTRAVWGLAATGVLAGAAVGASLALARD